MCMDIGKILLRYFLTFGVFLVVDLVWLGFVAKGIYNKWIGNFLGEVNWTAAIIFYLLFIAGVSIFVIYPASQKQSLNYALTYGAMMGILTYATYDLTNLATLKGWPWQIVLIDITWGAVLCMIVSAAGYFINQWIS